MTEPAYFNLHGQPLALSAKDAVLAREPLAYSVCRKVKFKGRRKAVEQWSIQKMRADGKQRMSDRLMANGGETEETAWRARLSAMRLEDEVEASKRGETAS